MISSFAVSVLFLVLAKNGIWKTTTHIQLLITVAFTSICWIATAYLAPTTDRRILIEFYRKTRPAGPGWEPIRREAGELTGRPADDIPRALVGWTTGCALIWSLLFSIGNFLYGRTTIAMILLAIAAVAATILIKIVNRIWSTTAEVRPMEMRRPAAKV
jgi:hypothetical protein